MNEMLDFYQKQAKEGLSSIPWLAQMQNQALDSFLTQGFPTRHDEEWKYTLVDSLLKQPFMSHQSHSHDKKDFHSDLPIKQQLFLHNGLLAHEPDWVKNLPKGVILLPLELALTTHESLIKPYLASILHQEHGFHALNTAMMRHGVFLYLPPGTSIEEPIAFIHQQDKEQQAVHLRHLIIAEAKSQVSIAEAYQGDASCCYFTNTVTEIAVGERAQVTHYKVQCESKAAYHLGHVAARLNTESQFFSHSLSLGGKLVRSDITIALEAEGAQCLMNGIYAPGDGQHIDHHTRVSHLVPSCSSIQDYKGILTGRSRAVFNGKVIVAKDAQHTDAQQQNKNLLLSSQAEINTKPQLEIFADDVLCSHGATVGQLDEEALFYLATRGIDRAEASQYLVQAFAKDNLKQIPYGSMSEWMGTLLMQQLG